MSGQFAQKQFAGDQFAGKQFGPDEGDSGIVWLSADLSGAGEVTAEISATRQPQAGAAHKNVRFRPFIAAEAIPRAVPAAMAGVGRMSVRTGAQVRVVGTVGVAGAARPVARTGATVSVRGVAGAAVTAGAIPRGAAAAQCAGVSAAGVSASASPSAGAVARGSGVAAAARTGRGVAVGVLNPSDEELAVMVLAAHAAAQRTRRGGYAQVR